VLWPELPGRVKGRAWVAIVPRHPREGPARDAECPEKRRSGARGRDLWVRWDDRSGGPPVRGAFASRRGVARAGWLEAPACDAGAGRKFRPPASRILSRLEGKTGGLLRELNELDQTNNESYGVILLRRLDRLTPPQTVAFELDPMGVMNDTIENGVGDCGITNYIVPLFDRNLACDEK
jgi:hypothetical protein